MSVLQQIEAHRSIRSFTGEAIDDAALARILAAATRASTAGGMQLYAILVTTDAARKDTLAAIHLGSETIRKAPVVLTFAVDTRRVGRWVEAHGHTPGLENMWGFAMGFSDALLAAENALLAAEGLGLGGCFLGTTFVSAPVLARFFACPSGVVPIATLALGHPAEDVGRGSRLPLEAVVHREAYRDPTPEVLEAAYREHAKETLARFATVPYVAAALQSEGIDHLAAYWARLMYPGELMRTAAAYFFGTVQTQGFIGDGDAARTGAVRRAGESPQIAALPPHRQLILAMALTSGHLDALLALPPGEIESRLAAFLARSDATLADDLATRGVFDTKLRARLYDRFAAFAQADAD